MYPLSLKVEKSLHATLIPTPVKTRKKKKEMYWNEHSRRCMSKILFNPHKNEGKTYLAHAEQFCLSFMQPT